MHRLRSRLKAVERRLSRLSYTRQQGLVDPDKLAQLSVTIAGLGSIGSFTALTLTKMGIHRFTFIDKDLVQLHNVSNQFFTVKHLGKPKVEVALEECRRHSPEPKKLDVLLKDEEYKDQQLDTDIVIAAFDNIEGRAALFKQSQLSQLVQLFIDTRMGGENFSVFSLNPHDSNAAAKYLQDFIDGVSNDVLPCTARSIAYNVLMVSSLVASHVKKFATGEPLPFNFSFGFQHLVQSKTLKASRT